MEHTHQPCPYIDCGSSDAFSYNDEGYGFCQSCKTGYPSITATFPWAQDKYPTKQKATNMERKFDLSKIKSATYEGIRGIDPDVCKLYGIVRYLDDKKETLGYGFKYSNNVKIRDNAPPGKGKTIFWKEKGAAPLEWFGPPFNAGTSKMLYITEGECLKPDAQVLTPNGWVALQDLAADDKVMQVHADGSSGFIKPIGIVDKDYEGNLVEYNSGSYYSITTEQHDMVRVYKGEFKKYKATKRIDLPIPRAVTYSAGNRLDLLQMQLWIMLSADFTFRKEGDIYGAFKKERKINRAKELLDSAGVRYNLSVNEGGYSSFFIHRGHDLGYAEKDLPWDLINTSNMRELLDEIIFWDGNYVKGRNQAEFSSNRLHNATIVQTMAHLCGYTSTIMRRSNEYGSWYKVSILFSKSTSSTQKGYNLIPYKGRVMCVTVPSGMILVRQNESISVIGNCDAASLYQAMGKTRPVVSASTGGISKKFLQEKYDELAKFDTIIWAGELDEAGRANADRLYNAFPEKMYYVSMTKHKDANDFLTAGDTDDLKWAALKPQRYSPDNFFCSDEAVETAILTENPYQYTPLNHTGLDGTMRGLIKGGLTFIKAPRGTGKCLHPAQGVLMYDGTVKMACEVNVGDLLMGPDSKPRHVLSLARGKEEMFKVIPTKGDPWICNRSHILALYNYDSGYITMSVDEYLSKSTQFQDRCVQYRSEGVEFSNSNHLPYDPYFVGMYLGDGSKHNNCVCLGYTKQGLVKYIYEYAKFMGWSISVEDMRGCKSYHFVTGGTFKDFKDMIFDEGSRIIPQAYLTASKEDREALLAGILDTDGYYNTGTFDIVQKSKALVDGICFVARSLGLAAYVKETTKGIKETGFTGTYYRISISGDFASIPFLRHKVKPRKQIKKVTRTNFTVESLGVGDYCGFEIDGDKLFLLDDFTVTHNTEIARFFEMSVLQNSTASLALLHMEEQKSTTYRSMASYHLGVNVRTKDDAEANGISEDQVVQAAKDATQGERTVVFEMRSHDDPLSLLDHVRLAATVYGCEYIFIDHVQRLAYLSSAGVDGATSTLTVLASRAAQLAKELNIGIIFLSQVNDDGRTKYASSLEEEAIVCIKLERDVNSEDEIERNTTHFILDKNRPFSKLGHAGSIYFDPETYILREEF